MFTLKRSFAPLALLSVLTACGGSTPPDDPTQPRPPGETTYRRFCISCHASGISGAPPAGNAAAWAPRLAQGEDVLLQHTIEGMPSGGMPPKGLCAACTEQELRDAIRYMATPKP